MSAYDFRAWLVELVVERWRERLWLAVPRRGVGLDLGGGRANAVRYPSRSRVVTCARSVARLEAVRAARPQAEALLVVAQPDALPFREHTFDWLVTSLTLCRCAQPERATNELARVGRPGGACYLLELTRPDGWIGRLFLGHDVGRALEGSGFHVERRVRVWGSLIVLFVGRMRHRDQRPAAPLARSSSLTSELS